MQARIDTWLLARFPRPVVVALLTLFYILAIMTALVGGLAFLAAALVGLFSFVAWGLVLLTPDAVNIYHVLLTPVPSLFALGWPTFLLFVLVKGVYENIDKELPKREKKS